MAGAHTAHCMLTSCSRQQPPDACPARLHCSAKTTMTLYYTLVFALLMFEMAMATVLLVRAEHAKALHD